MAFPITGILDNFNRANEGPPPSSSWTNVQNGLKVQSNVARGNIGNQGNWSNWNVETFGPDCECYLTMVSNTAVNVYARLSSVDIAADGYRVTIQSNEVKIYREDSGSATQLGAAISQTYANNDKLGIEIVGSTITAYYDDGGAGWGSIGTRTDGTYSDAGYIGAREFTTHRFDDFGGGTITGGITHQLAGSLNSASQLTGLLNLTQRLSGSLNSISHTSGVLRLIHGLSGTLNSASQLVGKLRLIQRLKGAINSISALIGNLRLIQRITGSLNSTTHLSGDLTIQGGPVTHQLSGSLNSSSVVSGTIRLIHGLTGTLQSASQLVGNIRLIQRIKGALNSVSILIGKLILKIRISGSLNSTSHLSGTLTEDRIQEIILASGTRTLQLEASGTRTLQLEASGTRTLQLEASGVRTTQLTASGTKE